MPRRPRFYAPGIVYHVTQFVPDQTSCFFADDDYRQCLNFLLDAALDYDCQIHAYVLLPHGLHMLFVPGDEQGIPRFMQSLARRYVAYINHTYQRRGPLWTQRYKACAIEARNYLMPVGQYIESRPVQMGYVNSPEDYRWSSYRNNALGISDNLTSFHPAYIRLGGDPAQRQQAYRKQACAPLEPALQQDIERSLALGLPLGSNEFKQALAQTLNVTPIALYPRRCVKRGDVAHHRNQEYSRSA